MTKKDQSESTTKVLQTDYKKCWLCSSWTPVQYVRLVLLEGKEAPVCSLCYRGLLQQDDKMKAAEVEIGYQAEAYRRRGTQSSDVPGTAPPEEGK